MIQGLPLRPDGSDPEAIHAQWVNDELTHRRKLGQTDGVGVSRTSRGDFVQPSEFSSGGSAVRAKTLFLLFVFDDYVACGKPPTGPSGSSPRFLGTLASAPGSPSKNDAYYDTALSKFRIYYPDTWVDMTFTLPTPASAIYVAKHWKNRSSLLGETILGDAHTYSYSDGPTETWGGVTGSFNITRTDDFTSEDQRIVPPWTYLEPIEVMPASTGVFREKLDEHGDPVLDGYSNPIMVPVGLLMLRSCGWGGPET